MNCLLPRSISALFQHVDVLTKFAAVEHVLPCRLGRHFANGTICVSNSRTGRESRGGNRKVSQPFTNLAITLYANRAQKATRTRSQRLRAVAAAGGMTPGRRELLRSWAI